MKTKIYTLPYHFLTDTTVYLHLATNNLLKIPPDFMNSLARFNSTVKVLKNIHPIFSQKSKVQITEQNFS